ncbi:sigma-70 family RNA polymerase sigma factor [Methylobacterium sp. CM6246]
MVLANEGEAPRAQLDEADESRPARPADVEIPAFAREHLGRELRSFYDAVLVEEQPARLLQLIADLGDVLTAWDASISAEFRTALIAALPGLRAFATSLAVDANRADDLVQETVMKAWANQRRFEPGTNFMAWLCTILRNHFYTEIRKRKREVEDAEGKIAAQMIAPAAQEHSADLRTLQVYLGKLPPTQREAIMLVAAQGMTYEAAAEVIGCQIGTVKSRVSRARTTLAERLEIFESTAAL